MNLSSTNIVNEDLYNYSRIRNTANFDFLANFKLQVMNEAPLTSLMYALDTVFLSNLSISKILS